jgi:hypothetical protein
VTALATDATTDTDAAVDTAGRIGLATHGVLYLAMGLVALQIAFGATSHTADAEGALAAIGSQPFGRGLLVLVAVGFGLYALWRASLAWRGIPEHPDSNPNSSRLVNGWRAVVAGALTVMAVNALRHPDNGSGGSAEATVFDWPGGRWLVLAAGAIVIGTAVHQIVDAIRRKFLDKLDRSQLSPDAERTIGAIGALGAGGRAAVFGLVGWFLLRAGIQHDPSEPKGLDQSLRELADTSLGTWLLVAAALGLALFGVLRLVEARYRSAART